MAPSKLSSVKNIQSGNSLTSSPKQNSDGTIFVNILINGTAVQAILDTASPITIIPKSVFEQLEHSDEIWASSVDAASIRDNKLNFIGSANLKFTICPGEYFYNVVHIYANDNVKPLIGNDLMALADIQINFAKKEVSSKGKPIPSIFTKPLQTKPKLKTRHKLTMNLTQMKTSSSKAAISIIMEKPENEILLLQDILQCFYCYCFISE